MADLEENVQSIMDYITEQTDQLDADQLWELYSMLSYRCRSKVDDLEDTQAEKVSDNKPE